MERVVLIEKRNGRQYLRLAAGSTEDALVSDKIGVVCAH